MRQHRERHQRGRQQREAPAIAARAAAQRDQRHDRQRGQLEGDQPGAEVAGRGDGGGAGGGGEHQADGDGWCARGGVSRSSGQASSSVTTAPSSAASCSPEATGRRGVEARGPGWPAGTASSGVTRRRAEPGDGRDGARRARLTRRQGVVGAPQPGRDGVHDQDRGRAQGGGEHGQEEPRSMLTTAELTGSRSRELVMAVASAMVVCSSGPGATPSATTASTRTATTSSSPPRVSTMPRLGALPGPDGAQHPQGVRRGEHRCRATASTAQSAEQARAGGRSPVTTRRTRRGTRPRSRPGPGSPRVAAKPTTSAKPSRGATSRRAARAVARSARAPAVLEAADDDEQQGGDDAVGDVGEQRGLQPGASCRWRGRARRSPCAPPRSRRPAA